jgi:hypothetical protein
LVSDSPLIFPLVHLGLRGPFFITPGFGVPKAVSYPINLIFLSFDLISI